MHGHMNEKKSWLRTEELPETCRVSYRSKFRKFVHLVGFITKKFVTLHGHMNEKTPDCGQRNCPKRVEFHTGVNLGNLCI